MPETLIAVRYVVTEPVNVVASMLAMLRSIRCNGLLPADTMSA